jgi:transcription termination/antitermination protein NusA
MTGFNISEAINEIQKEKNIPREELVSALETALASAYRKNFGPSTDIEVVIAEDGIKVFSVQDVVEVVEDPVMQIALGTAQSMEDDIGVGQKLRREITPERFGRIAAQTAKQVIMQKIREAERRLTYDAFIERIGTLIVGKVQRFERGDILVDHMGLEMVLPGREQIPGERYRPGDRVKALIAEVNRTAKGPQIVLSRTSREFLMRLFEQEIPEIQEGIVRVKSVAREPGIRAKVAVASTDGNVDPVGACVGLRGSRIQVIVNEVQGEKIDIVNWSDDIREFVSAALSPARPVMLDFDPDENKVVVHVPSSQLSLAIGREGQNVRLAARLTNVKIDIMSAEDGDGRGSGR